MSEARSQRQVLFLESYPSFGGEGRGVFIEIFTGTRDPPSSGHLSRDGMTNMWHFTWLFTEVHSKQFTNCAISAAPKYLFV